MKKNTFLNNQQSTEKENRKNHYAGLNTANFKKGVNKCGFTRIITVKEASHGEALEENFWNIKDRGYIKMLSSKEKEITYVVYFVEKENLEWFMVNFCESLEKISQNWEFNIEKI